MKQLIEFKEPWVGISEAEQLNSELRKELSPQHLLFRMKTNAIAIRMDCDDVLFETDCPEFPLAVVHITWSGTQETNPIWPHTEQFHDINEFVNTRMKDHIEYSE
jgi:hypothetical protein